MALLCNLLTRLIRRSGGASSAAPKPTLRVLLDGEHIANLDWLYDNQPLHYYRLTPLTESRSKLEEALYRPCRPHAELRVALQNSETGGLMPECFFISNLAWEDRQVSTREFGFFLPPPRQALPEDEVAGFGSWSEAISALCKAVEEDRLLVDE